mgnify:CR=1 FL=1
MIAIRHQRKGDIVQRQGLNSFAYSARHSCFATAGIDRTVRLWNADSCGIIEVLSGHKASVVDVVINDDFHQIISASADHTVKVWDIATGRIKYTCGGEQGHKQDIYSLDTHKDGRFIASGSGDKTVKLWDVEAGANTSTYFDHSDAVHSVQFSPDGKCIAAGGADKCINVWDTRSRELLQQRLERRAKQLELAGTLLQPQQPVKKFGFAKPLSDSEESGS